MTRAQSPPDPRDPRVSGRLAGWIGNVNTMPASDPELQMLRARFAAGKTTPLMSRWDTFEAWEANCVKHASAAILRMMNGINPGERPLSREKVIRQIEVNQKRLGLHRLRSERPKTP